MRRVENEMKTIFMQETQEVRGGKTPTARKSKGWKSKQKGKTKSVMWWETKARRQSLPLSSSHIQTNTYWTLL